MHSAQPAPEPVMHKHPGNGSGVNEKYDTDPYPNEPLKCLVHFVARLSLFSFPIRFLLIPLAEGIPDDASEHGYNLAGKGIIQRKERDNRK